MREVGVIGASIVGFLVLVAFLARGVGGTSEAVDSKVQIGQLTAELAGTRAEAETLRAELEKARADLKQAAQKDEVLRKRVAELEKRTAEKK